MTGKPVLDCDVAIAGGGMAGATLALALARWAPELRVRIIEAFPLPAEDRGEYQPSYDARSTALSWGTAEIYRSLDLWSAIEARATPIKRIHVSQQGRFGATRLSAAEHGQPALGYVVDNRWLGQCLLASLRATPGFVWDSPASLEDARIEPGAVRLTLSRDGQSAELAAGLLVLADGGRSPLRERLGFAVEDKDYHQHALIANVTTGQSHDYTAYERFTPEGPVALLPRGDIGQAGRESALVWTLPEAEVASVAEWDEDTFLARLQDAFGWRLGRFVKVGERHTYPLALRYVNEPVSARVALVGNAAQSLHPVAGQGFNLAIRGLMHLAGALAGQDQLDSEAAIQTVLDRYARAYAGDRHRVMGLSDSLATLFDRHSPVPPVLRELGLVGLDLIAPARHWFARQAMGLGDRRARPRSMGEE